MSHDLLVQVLVVLLAISEGVALIPALKSNSILQLVINSLKALVGADKSKV